LLSAGKAEAQVSGSVSVVSDYRYRGVSLSNGHAAFQGQLEYNRKSGWYAGAFASQVESAEQNGSDAQLMAYGGYSWRALPSIAWEVGAARTIFAQDAYYNYTEIFAGMNSEKLSGRIYFSPDYFGAHARTLYAEANGTYPIGERFQLFGHIGYLWAFSEVQTPAYRIANQFDLAVGGNVNFAPWRIRLAWFGSEKNNHGSRFYEGKSSPAIVLDVSYTF
jgi:uncharacterized protein (TIGR02001 family)